MIHDRVVQLNPGVWTVRSARNNHRDSEDTEGAQRSVFINKTLCVPSVFPVSLWLLRRPNPAAPGWADRMMDHTPGGPPMESDVQDAPTDEDLADLGRGVLRIRVRREHEVRVLAGAVSHVHEDDG